MKSLKAKQRRFVDEYLFDLNATQAAIRTGYSKKTAKEIGYELLTKPHIRMHIQEGQKKLEEETTVKTKWVIRELKDIYEHCRQKVMVLDVDGNPTGEWRFEVTNAIRCLELLGKHIGMFKEKVEIGRKDGKFIEIDVVNVKAKLVEKLTKLASSEMKS